MDTLKEPPIFVRSQYNYDTNKASADAALDTGPESAAKQEFKDECDINTIVRLFGVTGQLPEAVRAPTYGDFTHIGDYQSALHQVMAAQEAFGQMPAHVRERFANDPQRFLEFCANKANREEATKLGLVFDVEAATQRATALATPLATPSPQPSQSNPEQSSGQSKAKPSPRSPSGD